MVKGDGVGYLRLDKTVADENSTPLFSLGRSIRYREGADVALFATGGILRDAIQAAELLQELGIDAGVVSMYSIKPIDKDTIIAAVNETGGIVTIEEHNINGGLGSAVAEVCMDNGFIPKKFLRIGLDNQYSSIVGSQDYLKAHYQIDTTAIVKRVKMLLE